MFSKIAVVWFELWFGNFSKYFYFIPILQALLMTFVGLVLTLDLTFRLLSGYEQSDYEVWQFGDNILQVFQFKAPCKKLKTPQLSNYSNDHTLVKIVPLFEIENVGRQEYCNEGGYYYTFSLYSVNFSRSIHTSEQDSVLLVKSIRSWLRR